MMVRGTTAGTPFGAKLTVLGWAALALLAPVAVSACTSGSSTTSPTIISPTVTNLPTATGATSASSGSSASSGTSGTSPSPGSGSGSAPASGTPGVSSGSASALSSPRPAETVTTTVTAAASPNSQSVPHGAADTGGGGTAGFQDILLLVLGMIVRSLYTMRHDVNPDEPQHLHVAWGRVQGLLLYRDIFDRKPPIPPLAYAASFGLTGSTDIRPLRVVKSKWFPH